MQLPRRLSFQINPIIIREVRTRMRGARPYVILTAFLMLLMLAGLGIYQLMLQQARFGAVLLSAQVGQALFKGLAFFELFLIVVLAPALTSSAISGERERLTYDMLLATPLRPGQLLWGKLIAALSYLLLLIFAAVPIFSVVLVFGGIDPQSLLKTMALLLATTITFGAIGLFCSALLRQSSRATIVSYVLVLVVIGVPTLIASVWGQFSTPQGQNPPPWLIYLNPFSALISITTISPPTDGGAMPFFGYGDPLSALPFFNQLTPGVIWYGPMGAEVLPIYRGTLVGYGLLVTVLIWISSHLALPARRWRPRWSDVAFGLALVLLLAAAWYSRSWWYVEIPAQLQPPFMVEPAKG
ncbi:MAG: ABC transporter permease subunit [Oscillochloris sp.]|nr:ABC transporter permease subunit [Oscillochloris sp.]